MNKREQINFEIARLRREYGTDDSKVASSKKTPEMQDKCSELISNINIYTNIFINNYNLKKNYENS